MLKNFVLACCFISSAAMAGHCGSCTDGAGRVLDRCCRTNVPVCEKRCEKESCDMGCEKTCEMKTCEMDCDTCDTCMIDECEPCCENPVCSTCV